MADPLLPASAWFYETGVLKLQLLLENQWGNQGTAFKTLIE